MRTKTIDQIKHLISLVDEPTQILCQILDLVRYEERAEEMAKDVQEMIYLVNVTDSLISIPPTHPLYKSILRDVQASINRLKRVHKALPDDA
jgi:hypothetical protein